MAILIAFYSRAGENYFGGTYRRVAAGNTEKAAEMLSRLTGGKLFKIEQARPYSENYQTCIAEAKADLQKKARPEVLNLPENLDAYDEIYLGYPNYWGTMPMAVYTFLERYDFTGKTVVPFMTNGGWPGHVIKDMKALCPGADAVCEMQVKFDSNGGDRLETPESKIEAWAQSVKALL